MRRRSRIIALIALAILATALPAKACSCFQGDPRDMLKEADGAFIGTLLSKTPLPDDPYTSIYTFSVEETFKGTFEDTADVVSATDGATCGLEVPLGEQTGLFLRSVDSQWHSGLCEQIAPQDLRNAAAPLPEPDGEGPIAMLASGSYGEAGIVALDSRGRTLAYGEREPSSSALTVCPRSSHFLEIYGDFRDPRVAVRDTASMDVLREFDLPIGRRPYRNTHVVDLACADEEAGVIFIAARRDNGQGYVFRIRNGTIREIYSAPAGMLDLEGTDLYATEGKRRRFLVKLGLMGGGRDGIARLPVRAFQPRVSPNGRWIAMTAGANRGKLVVIEVASGDVRVETLGVGYAGEALWLSNRRIGYFAGGYDNARIEVFTRRLARVSRVPGEWYTMDNLLIGDTAWGLGWGTLYRADLPAGPAEVVRRFDSPTMYSLVRVPDEVFPTGSS